MENLNSENQRLRSVLVRVKYLLNNQNIEEANRLVIETVDTLPFRDPKTGEEYSSGREESKRLHN